MNRKEIKFKQSYLRQENARYSATFERIPESSWPRAMCGQTVPPIEVWRNREYLVQVFPPINGAVRLSIIRTMIKDDGGWVDGMTWDDLSGVKDGVGFADKWAVELFPPIDSVVNVANMRHLWVIATKPEFAW